MDRPGDSCPHTEAEKAISALDLVGRIVTKKSELDTNPAISAGLGSLKEGFISGSQTVEKELINANLKNQK
jgi:hypothetical protein